MSVFTERAPEDVAGAPGWSFNWGAVIAGVLFALGLQTMLTLFGMALGLSLTDPYQITRHEHSYALPAATIAWLVITALASMFIGAWIAGHFSRLTNNRDAAIHGALVWALSMVALAFGIGSLTNLIPGPQTSTPEKLAYGYSSLDDPQFTSFVIERARNWKPGTPEEPINVSADVTSRVDPKDVPDNEQLRSFVKNQTALNDNQAESFLEANRTAIAREQAAAQRRWEEANATDLARADRARRAASAAAWTLTALAFLTLAASIGGSILGWWQRDHELIGRRGDRMDRGDLREPDVRDNPTPMRRDDIGPTSPV
jgi:hypothetical protein